MMRRVALHFVKNTWCDGLFGKAEQLPKRSIILSAFKNNNTSETQSKVPKIYTRTGDQGTSSLFTGERRPKNDFVFDTLGDVDEVSCNVGLSKNTMMESWQNENFKELANQFEKIQSVLQDVNSCVATPLSSASEARLERVKFDDGLTEELEEWIDFYTAELPALKNFILPSGGLAATHIHVTRSVCRRAERKVASLAASGEIHGDISKYMNRLSDYFFTIARYVAMMEGHVEKIYKKPKRKTESIDANLEDKMEDA
ncbi:corrinoid adenosyltransferase MMAB-like [Styela clava]|uniref:corrinoid adenosyltransferase-like n=1 Tax=Styela clava TaxID=7725 RepID=UPI00193A2B50|nr:corrinoid adenosyltransferase-like [Styela clava]